MSHTTKSRRGGRSLNTLTVAELIELLTEQDPNALVLFKSDYGDYHHTQQALPFTTNVEEVRIGESAYSHSGWEVLGDRDADDDDDDEEARDDDAPTYLVIG